jgi:hypothetical protein
VKRVVELCGCRAGELGEGMVRCWGGGDWRGDVIVVRDVERDMIGVLDVGIGGGGNATRMDELDKVLLLDERESDRESARARARARALLGTFHNGESRASRTSEKEDLRCVAHFMLFISLELWTE